MIELGPFDLDAPIGQGGMGEVWRGRHTTQNVAVAVKVITSERVRTSRYLHAFHREVQTMAGLEHPCIITVLDYGEISEEAAQQSGGRLVAGSPYLAMELANGGTLLDIALQLEWPQLRCVLLDVLDALAHAHARGVIHRDLKPDNVLLFSAPDGDLPLLKLTDFGMAHAMDDGASSDAVGSTAGTPEFMAPEQLMGRWRDYGPWTDLYALGCMTYQLCAGRLPFHSPDLQTLMHAHIHHPPPPLRARMALPEGFEGWLMRLLSKAPEARFQRAADAAWSLLAFPEELTGRALLGEDAGLEPAAQAVTLCFTEPVLEAPGVGYPGGSAPPTEPELPGAGELEGAPRLWSQVHGSPVMPALGGAEPRRAGPTRWSSSASLAMAVIEAPPTPAAAIEAPPTPVTTPLARASAHPTPCTALQPTPAELPLTFAERSSPAGAAPEALGSHGPTTQLEASPARAPREAPRTMPLLGSGEVGGGAGQTLTSADALVPLAPAPAVSAPSLSPIEQPPLPESWQRVEPQRSMQLVGAGLELYGLRPVPLIDRVVERDVIWRALHRVRDEHMAWAVLIEGASGTGKSRLAEWMVERAHEVGGAIVLKATHGPMTGGADGLPRMIANHLRCVGLSVDEMLERTRQLLAKQGIEGDDYDARVMTETMSPCAQWGDAPEPRALSQQQSPTIRYVVLRRLLERLSGERPVMLWLDDVQWGRDTLRFIEHVLGFQRLSPSPLLFLMTVNDEELARRPREARLLRQLCLRARVERCTIGALPPRDHAQLTRQLLRLEGTLAREVAERTAGNPLFAVQLVGDWVERGLLEVGPRGFQLRAGVEASLPDDIHQVWRTRLEELIQRLRPRERERGRVCLELAAALGRDIDEAQWRACCEVRGVRPPRGFVAALVSAQLARRTDAGWSFTHGMLCESIERSAREARRWADHHRACAQALALRYQARQPGVAERLARHHVEAGAPERALDPLLIAANEGLENSDFDHAMAQLERRDELLNALGASPDDPRWVEGWICQAGMRVTQGQLEEAERLIGRSLERLGDDAPLSAEVLRLRGMIAEKRGDSETGLSCLREALHHYHRIGNAAGIAHCLHGIGNLHDARGEFTEATAALQSAIDLFERLDDLDGVGMCLSSQASICRQLGDFERARELLGHAMSFLERSGNRVAVAGCLNDLGDVARSRDDLGEAAAFYRQALRGMEEVGSLETLAPRNNLALIHLARHRYKAARRILERLLTEVRVANRPGYEGVIHIELLPCMAALGDWEGWRHHRDHALSLLEAHPLISDDIAFCAERAAELAAAAGRIVFARQACALSIEHWEGLGRHDRAEEVRARLDALSAPGDEQASQTPRDGLPGSPLAAIAGPVAPPAIATADVTRAPANDDRLRDDDATRDDADDHAARDDEVR